MIDIQRELTDARERFRAFYAQAAPHEEKLFDAVVLAHAAYTLGVRTPRQGVPLAALAELERATDQIERRLMELMLTLRTTRAFQQLPPAERSGLERLLGPVELP